MEELAYKYLKKNLQFLQIDQSAIIIEIVRELIYLLFTVR